MESMDFGLYASIGCPICGTLCATSGEVLQVRVDGERPLHADPAVDVIWIISSNTGADVEVGASELPQPDLQAGDLSNGPEREVE